MDALQRLIGQTVERIAGVLVEGQMDSIQVIFTDGTIMNILNPYRYDGADLFAVSKIQVRDACETDELLSIRFENNKVLQVDMTDDASVGPEAIVLVREGEPTVVWN